MKTWFMITAAALSLAACTPSVVEKLPYYKMPVVQGIPLDVDVIMSVQTGMTREQVELTLGKPLLRPAFRDNQWVYDYAIMHGGKIKEKRDLTVYFNGDRVSRVSGSALDYAHKKILRKNNSIQK